MATFKKSGKTDIENLSMQMMPDAVKERTFQHMEICSLLLLVNTSEDLRRDLRRYRLKECSITLRMIEKMNDINVAYCTETNAHRLTFMTPEHGQFYLNHRWNTQLRTLGKLQMDASSLFEGSWEFVTSNIFKSSMMAIEHLRDIFPRLKISYLEIDFARVNDIDHLCKVLKNVSCKQASLSMTGEDPAEKTKLLLPRLRDIEHLELRMFHIPFDFDEPIFADQIEISMATWVNNFKMSTWKFKYCRLSSTRYTSEDYAEFIIMWLTGSFKKLKKMAMAWNRHDVDRDVVVELTNAKKWNEQEMEGRSCDKDEYAKFYVRRNDGTVGVLRTFRQYFQFIIWEGKPVVD